MFADGIYLGCAYTEINALGLRHIFMTIVCDGCRIKLQNTIVFCLTFIQTFITLDSLDD